MTFKALIADNDELSRRRIHRALCRTGGECWCGNLEQALVAATVMKPNVIVVNVDSEDSGEIRLFRTASPGSEIVAMTRAPKRSKAKQALNAGAYSLVGKASPETVADSAKRAYLKSVASLEPVPPKTSLRP